MGSLTENINMIKAGVAIQMLAKNTLKQEILL